MIVDPAKVTFWTGDRLPSFAFTLKRGGTVINLTSHTVTIRIAKKSDRSLVVTDSSVTVTSAADGECSFTLASALDAGTYFVQIKIVDGSSRAQHSGFLILEVLEAI